MDTSNHLQHDTSSIRPIQSLIEFYNPSKPDHDYGFDSYWDAHSYKKHHLCFYCKINKQLEDKELDSHEVDQALNRNLANAGVDPWQHKCQFIHQPSHSEAKIEINRGGPQVSQATAVEANFVNTLVTRSGEPDWIPLTTNLGLNKCSIFL